jgi:hypothetical protein
LIRVDARHTGREPNGQVVLFLLKPNLLVAGPGPGPIGCFGGDLDASGIVVALRRHLVLAPAFRGGVLLASYGAAILIIYACL